MFFACKLVTVNWHSQFNIFRHIGFFPVNYVLHAVRQFAFLGLHKVSFICGHDFYVLLVLKFNFVPLWIDYLQWFKYIHLSQCFNSVNSLVIHLVLFHGHVETSGLLLLFFILLKQLQRSFLAQLNGIVFTLFSHGIVNHFIVLLFKCTRGFSLMLQLVVLEHSTIKPSYFAFVKTISECLIIVNNCRCLSQVFLVTKSY